MNNTLSTIQNAARIAQILLQDLVEDYFCDSGEIEDDWGLARICFEYPRASAKAEIARDLLIEISAALKDLPGSAKNHESAL